MTSLNILKRLTVGLMVGILTFLVYQYSSRFTGGDGMLEIKGEKFYVEVADTPKEWAQGLSGRNGLGVNEGMLFVFDESGRHGFWMKDMKFPIDIIWISGDKVVYISPMVSPDSYPNLFKPPVPADKVLEINAGLSRKFGITEGTPLVYHITDR